MLDGTLDATLGAVIEIVSVWLDQNLGLSILTPLGLSRLKAVTPGQTSCPTYPHWLATVDEGSGSSMDALYHCGRYSTVREADTEFCSCGLPAMLSR